MFEITPQMRVNCVTHNDMDGVFSGLVIRKKYPQAIVYITNYGRNIESYWMDCDVLIVTDYSFDGLKTLMEMENNPNFKLIWIDHHVITEEAKAQGFCPEGLRRQDVSAACLCWEYCFPNTEIPTVIKYISDYDVWEWQKNPNALYFQNAIRNQPISINQKTGTEFFNALLTDANLLNRFVINGKKIEEYNDLRRKLVCKDGAFVTKLNGIDALACNIKTTNSTIFQPMDKVFADYPLRILFAYFSSINGYRVSVFSNQPDKYSCHEICKQYGGGGHDGAGGFQMAKLKDLPFALPDRKELDDSKQFQTDIFHELKAVMDQDAAVENYVKGSNKSIVYGYSFGAVVAGFTACCVNDSTGHPSMFYQAAKDSLYQIGVFYNLMNNGWWRYRIHVLDPSIDIMDVLMKVKNSCLAEQKSCVISFNREPPIPVGGSNGTN